MNTIVWISATFLAILSVAGGFLLALGSIQAVLDITSALGAR